VIYRDAPVILMSQRLVLGVFSVGIVFVNVSLIPRVFSVSSPNAAACNVHNFFFYTSLALVISSLCAKEWRAWLVYERSQSLRSVKISNTELFTYIGVAVGIMLILVVVWIAAFASEPDPCDEFRCETSGNAIAYVAFCYILLLIMLTIAISIVSRNVPAVASEKLGILVTGLFALFACVFVGTIVVSEATDIAVEIWLLSFSVFVCSLVSSCLIVYRKLFWLDLTGEEVRQEFFHSRTSWAGGPGSRAETSFRESDNSFNGGTRNSSTNYRTGEFTRHSTEHSYVPPSWKEPIKEEEPQKDKDLERAEVTSNTSTNLTDDMNATGTDLRFLSSAATSARSSPEPENTEAEASMQSVENLLEEHRKNGFKIGDHGPWEEYVDRESGDTFFLNTNTGERRNEVPLKGGEDAGMEVDRT